MIIEEKVKEYSVKNISKKLDISEATIYRYIKGEGIEGHVKFIEFIKFLNIDLDDIIKEIKK